MRRFLGLLLLCASAALIAAAPPAATPAPVLTPAPRFFTPPPGATRAPSQASVPTVVVYPFTTPADVDPRTGAAIAQIYAQVLQQSGGLKILDLPDQIKREDYTKYAHAKGADYYISGYLQPIGESAAIVWQIYDVTGDISVYSSTTEIANVQDVASQGLNARDIIMRAAGIDRPEIATEPHNTPTPTATNGASESLSSLFSVFHGKGKGGTPKPGSTPTPEPKPDRATIVAHLTGNASATALDRGTDALFRALSPHYTTTLARVPVTDPVHQADSVCGAQRNTVINASTLSDQHIGGFHAHEHYTFKLTVYTCFGAVLATYTTDDDDYVKAITSAVDSYVTDHPDNS